MKKIYESPQIEVLCITVEQGFSASSTPVDDMPYGNHNW